MTNTFLDHSITIEKRMDGAIIFGSGLKLGPVANNSIEWLDHWAETAANRVFLAERKNNGWHEITYSQTQKKVRAVAGSLLARGINSGDRIAVLSGPSIDHGILALATQMIGVVLVPLAEQYSLVPEARSKLVYCIGKTNPVLAYASNAFQFDQAISDECMKDITIIAGDIQNASRDVIPFDDLVDGTNRVEEDHLEAAYEKVGPKTLAKILFTSGSTSNPKGVPQTQRMMCVNQAQYLACLPFMRMKAQSILSWLPWNHVFAGNSDFNLMLSNGGSLYLDDGKPVGKLFDRTLENIRSKAGSLSLNVPIAHGLAMAAMKDDIKLQQKYFGNLDMFFYAGASLPSEVWNAVEEMAMATNGKVPLMTSSWGLTETAPCCLIYYQPGASSGMIGVPVPELETKLIPLEKNRFEIRVRGPNVFEAYLDDPEKSKSSFDEDGFFITGDAVRWVEPDNPALGVYFDGRLTEDFKLTTGTWVQATNLRVSALGALQGLVQDLIIVGEGYQEIGLFIFPALDKIPQDTKMQDGCYVSSQYNQDLRAALQKIAETATGSSNRLKRAVVLSEPPSVADGEITAKGSFNSSIITKRRNTQLKMLYDDNNPAVIKIN